MPNVRAAPGEAPTPFSFELFPPRSAAAAATLPETVARLAATGPEFLSVTYGAGGSSRDASLELVRRVLTTTNVEPMAHVTCVGSTDAELETLVGGFLDAGVRRFLAIRGDPPADAEVSPGRGLQTTVQLVRLIRRTEEERGSGTARRKPLATVAVAAFVTPPSPNSWSQHIDALLAKQNAGADLALTQVFFHAGDYAQFLERARAAGVVLPVVPGIMPVTSLARLERVLELSGAAAPRDLRRRLDAEDTADGRREVGIEFAAALSHEVISAGAPAVHLYTLNHAEPSLALLERLGLISRSAPPSFSPRPALSGSAHHPRTSIEEYQ